MKPIIGITCPASSKRYYLPKNYVLVIKESGGIPFIVPSIEEEKDIEKILSLIDGLMLTGGGDTHPKFYGQSPKTDLKKLDEERDIMELSFIKLALKRDIPILGICRGLQILNIAGGGSLNQTTPQHWDTRNLLVHEIEIKKGTTLFNIIKGERIKVNSTHHQSVRKLAPEFKISAQSPDGVIEGIESKEHKFILGVQFHPERLFKRYPVFKELFAYFIKSCS